MTEFLDNVIAYERRVFCRNYFSPGRLYLQRGKDRVQEFAFKQECVFAIFGKSAESLEGHGSIGEGLLPRIECSGDEIGYWIYKSREGGFSDKKIYNTIVGARDAYLEKRNLCQFDFVAKKMSRQVYEAASKELRDFCLDK